MTRYLTHHGNVVRGQVNALPLLVIGLVLYLSSAIPLFAQRDNFPGPPPVVDNQNIDTWTETAAQKAAELMTWADGDRLAILNAMQSWAAPDRETIGVPIPTGVFYRADLDRDGVMEYLLGMPIPIEQENSVITCSDFRCPRMLYLFERNENGFQLAHTFAFGDPVIPWIEGADIYEMGDFTADGLIEIAYSTAWCGAHTCGVDMRVGRWDGTAWTNLGSMSQSYTEIRLQNVDLDAVTEFVFRGGFVGSAGAGIQRERTDIYDWNGTDYVLASTIWDEITDPYYLMLDAYSALKQGHAIRAIDYANQVLNFADQDYEQLGLDKNSLPVMNTRAYAAGLAAIAYIQLGEIPSAGHVLEPFISLQGVQVPAVYAVQDLWMLYQQNGDLSEACEAMESRLIEDIAGLDESYESLFLDFLGYNMEVIPNEELCPL